MRPRSAAAMVFVLVGLSACAEEIERASDEAIVDRDGVTIVERTGDRLEGRYVGDGGKVEFVATRTGTSSGELVLVVNGKRFTITGSLARNLVALDGSGHVLDVGETKLLDAM